MSLILDNPKMLLAVEWLLHSKDIQILATALAKKGNARQVKTGEVFLSARNRIYKPTKMPAVLDEEV